MISYLPAMKDKDGNRIIGLMGQFDDEHEATVKLYGDFIFWVPIGLSPDGIVEYDPEIGLPNVPTTIHSGLLGDVDCAVISGPQFDDVVNNSE